MMSGVLGQVVDIPGRHIEQVLTDPKDDQDEVGKWVCVKVVAARIRNMAQHRAADKELPM